MSARSFSMDMTFQFVYKTNKEIIEKFKKAKMLKMEFVSISYLLKNIDMPKTKIYDSIFDLLELDIIEVKEFSICPYCLNEDIVDYKHKKTQCKKCNTYYIKNDIIEKFKMIKLDDND